MVLVDWHAISQGQSESPDQIFPQDRYHTCTLPFKYTDGLYGMTILVFIQMCCGSLSGLQLESFPLLVGVPGVSSCSQR